MSFRVSFCNGFIMLLLSSCVTSQMPQRNPKAFGSSHSSRVFRRAMEGRIDSFDPAKIQSAAESFVLRQCFEPLIYIEPDNGRIVPLAAERYEFSTDGMTLRFILKSDLKWSDGSSVTAYDFEYAFQRILRASTDSPHRLKLLGIKGVAETLDGEMISPREFGVTAVSPTELRIEFSLPSFRMLQIFAQPWSAPLKKYFEGSPKTYRNGFDNWASNGAFLPVRSNSGALLLRKNPFHRFANRINIDEVSVLWFGSLAELNELRAQMRIHLMGQTNGSFTQLEWAQLSQGKILEQQTDLRTLFLRVNNAKVPLSQPEIRQALSMVIDREALSALSTESFLQSAFSILPDIYGYKAPSTSLYGPGRAQRVLAEYGYCVDEETDGACRKGGHIELLHLNQNPDRQLAMGLQNLLERRMPFSSVELVALSLPELSRRVSRADFDLVLDEVGAQPENPFSLIEAFLPSKISAGSYSNVLFQKQILLAQNALSLESMLSHYQQAESILLDGAEIVPLLRYVVPYVRDPKLKGFEANPLDAHWVSRYTLR